MRNMVKELYRVCNELEDRIPKLSSKLSMVDKAINDMEHFIEITDEKLTDKQCSVLYTNLRKLRLTRREIKEEIELVRKLERNFNAKNQSKMLEKILFKANSEKDYDYKVLKEKDMFNMDLSFLK